MCCGRQCSSKQCRARDELTTIHVKRFWRDFGRRYVRRFADDHRLRVPVDWIHYKYESDRYLDYAACGRPVPAASPPSRTLTGILHRAVLEVQSGGPGALSQRNGREVDTVETPPLLA